MKDSIGELPAIACPECGADPFSLCVDGDGNEFKTLVHDSRAQEQDIADRYEQFSLLEPGGTARLFDFARKVEPSASGRIMFDYGADDGWSIILDHQEKTVTMGADAAASFKMYMDMKGVKHSEVPI